MIEKIFSTTDGKIKVRIPTILNEITLGQMLEMQSNGQGDEMDAISILSGISKMDLYTVCDLSDLQIFNVHVRSLAQQVKYLYNSNIVPHNVVFMLGKRKVGVNVIRNLSIEPAGAFVAAKDIIADEINAHINQYGEDNWQQHFQPSLQSCCSVLSQYFFCRATGKKYDEQDVWAFESEIKKLKVTEALPIAKYFFSSYPDLIKQQIGFFQRLREYWRRRQILRRLRKINEV
jgi:hypothetical protein